MAAVYNYFPGCSLKGTGVAYEESLRALFGTLDLRLEELRDWNCCGATSYMAMDQSEAFVLSARVLAQAGQAPSGDLLAPCSACYLALRKTQDYAERYPQIDQQTRAALSLPDDFSFQAVRVRHPLEVLYVDVGTEALRARAVRAWHGGRVACYYGCQLVRPYAEADRAYDPRRMDELLEAVGIPTVPYSLKTKCCGASLTGTMHDVGVRLNYILLKEAARQGAQAIATICPLCQFNLDTYQAEIRRATGENLEMPVFFFSQLLGWALGAETASLGLRRSISGQRDIKHWFQEHPVEAENYV